MSEASFNCRLIQDGAHSGVFNMAADLFFATSAAEQGQPILRLYRWDQPTLSVGYHQKLPAQMLQLCQAQSIPIVRRPTGGRAVLHDQELTYAFVAPHQHPFSSAGVGALIRGIGEILVEAGRRAGLEPELVRSNDHNRKRTLPLRQGSSLCFDSLSRWEVRLAGRKWIGSAQRSLPQAILQHGSILLTLQSSGGVSTFRGTRANSHLEKADNGKAAPPIDEANLRQTIPEAFSAVWGIQWSIEEFTTAELARITAQASHNLKIPEFTIP